MIPLAISVAIPGEHAFTCLETDAPSCHAATVGTAGVFWFILFREHKQKARCELDDGQTQLNLCAINENGFL
jgi:hypothetical protein